MKNFTSAALALLLCTTAAQATVVNLIDGYSGVYDPANTYVPSGVLGTEWYSFRLFFTDPTHGFDVTLTAPDDLVGSLAYAISFDLDATGASFGGGNLLAGQSSMFTIGELAGATPESPFARSLTIAILNGDGTEYSLLEPDSELLVSNFGYVDTGTGTDPGGDNGWNDNDGSVPIAGTPGLIGLGILLMGLIGQRFERRPEDPEV